MTRRAEGAGLLAHWKAHFGDVPPIGYLLRTSDRFEHCRVLSLAGGKRYPTSLGEVRALLAIHHTVFDIVLANAPTMQVMRPRDAEKLGFRFDQSFEMDTVDMDGETVVSTFNVLQRNYDFSTYIDTILTIADDEARAVWLNGQTMNVVAPYDGGIDVLFSASGYEPSLASTIRCAVPDGQLPNLPGSSLG